MNDVPKHTSVMLHESIEMLQIEPGKIWIDATVGAAGHLYAIQAKAGPDATIIGIDRDQLSIERLQTSHLPNTDKGRIRLFHANFSEIAQVSAACGIESVTGGILADLGVSSMQLDDPERGFSFSKDGPLDMRMDPTAKATAADLVNNLPETDLANIIYQYGEERLSRQIARRIVEARPISTTAQLAAVVSPVIRRQRKNHGFRDESHPATRTFQALRIAVNDELGHIETFLQQAIQLLAPGGRLVVITFHSLEDRIVKQVLRLAESSCICPPRHPICICHKKREINILTKKPLLPNPEEVLANPRSRSAKLRAGEKVS